MTLPNLIRGNAEIGTHIRVYRLTRGWTQTFVAKRLGVSRSYLSKLETGKLDIDNQPSFKKLLISRL
jgi:transcriptional regulator with XRE-family HTH domain